MSSILEQHDFVIIRETFIGTRDYLVKVNPGEKQEDLPSKVHQMVDCDEIDNSVVVVTIQSHKRLDLREVDQTDLMVLASARRICPPDEIPISEDKTKVKPKKRRKKKNEGNESGEMAQIDINALIDMTN